MDCPKCGHDNIEGATYCAQCGTPFTPSPDKDENSQHGARKVVKLPSDGSEQEVVPIERPWEVRVPKYNASTPGNSGRTSVTRKRAGATGKVPAIKRPAEAGAEEIPSAEPGKAVAGASIGGAAGQTSDFKAVDPSKNPAGRDHTPVPRRVQKETAPNIAIGDEGGKGKKAAAIIAIVFICAIAAAIAFFLLNGKVDKVVTFETNGGTSIAQQDIIDGGKIDQPANPVREGYTFEGWFLDPDYSEPASFPIEVTEDMTLYAKWKADEKPTAQASSSSSSASTNPDGTANTDGTTPGGTATGGNDSSNAGGTNTSNGNSSGGTANNGGNSNGNGSSGNSGTSGGGNGGGNGNSGNGSDNGNSTAQVSVIAQNGERLSGTVHLKNGYVIPDSSKKAYTIKELRAMNLNDAELCIARNEPYARMGYSFRNPGLQAYFNARSWYHNKGWRGELPKDSAGYVTAHNLLKIAEENKGASKWLRLSTR